MCCNLHAGCQLLKLNFPNPHSNLHLAVPNGDGTTTEWVLTTASIQVLARDPQDHGASGKEREPGRIHPAPRARRSGNQTKRSARRFGTNLRVLSAAAAAQAGSAASAGRSP